MIWLILGAGSGFLIGAIGMAMMKTASEADDSMEEFYKRFDKKRIKNNQTGINRKKCDYIGLFFVGRR